ncbi:MAG: NAD+ synthase [Bacteroidota bacterium]|nr:NAD+ synthase [Bacteroidota bacterium]
MKIALSQLNFHIANFEKNRDAIINSIDKARNDGADLVIFSELAVCGYPPQDLLELQDFYDKCNESVELIARSCIGIAAIIGSPSINPNPLGKKLYNSAFFLSEGKVQNIVHKALLPTYDIFDEYRYFEPSRDFNIIEFKGHRIALTICEDLWDDQPSDNPFGKAKLYTVSPMDELARQNPDFIINIAASPFSYNKEKIKKNIFTDKAARYNLPLFYLNQVGANTELIFDGGSMVIGADGKVLSELSVFQEDYRVYELEEIISGNYTPELIPAREDIEKIHDALILGIRDYFQKMGFSKATLGLSGGIDSAVTLVLANEALGSENIRVLLMPSQYSSDHSITDAVELAENLGVKYDIMPIHEIFHQFERNFHPLFAGLAADITEENIQARIRGVMLMALSNKYGHILLNTSNKSEAAVGYGTLYGDMNGGLSVLGDVYKTRVFELARYINRDKETIPVNTITKPPSAELRPDQKDSDSLPEYDVLDRILHAYIEDQLSSNEIMELGFSKALVDKVIQMVNRNEYKRFQTPPILRISSKAFGIGRRIPIVAKY